MLSIGIDGGGSTLRVGIFNEKLECLHLHEIPETANPSSIGFVETEKRLRFSVLQTLDEARLDSSEVLRVGAGMAGVAQNLDWLREVLVSVFPQAKITVAPDYEIALIGAHGKRYGILVLSGTGSAACGINASGELAHSGGWGYLLGDEGSGYWLGLETLKAVARAADGREKKTKLFVETLANLKISDPDELITWLYAPEPNNRKIAKMASLVLSAASHGDSVANKIIESGAEHLYQLYMSVVKRLNFADPPVMFAGGLLISETPLRRLLMQKIGLNKVPSPKYSPAAGAALMAQLS